MKVIVGDLSKCRGVSKGTGMINVKEVRSLVNVKGKVKGNVNLSFRMKCDVP